jgi:hypothetical protein
MIAFMVDIAIAFDAGRATGHLHGGAQIIADPLFKEVAALRHVDDLWKTYLRDRGVGDVGREHRPSLHRDHVLETESVEWRDAMLSWLVINAHQTLRAAATRVASMVGAVHVFGDGDQATLDYTLDCLEPFQALDLHAIGPLRELITTLRRDFVFAERRGEAAFAMIAGKAVSHYVTAIPTGTWALNLALAARRRTSSIALLQTGLFSRAMFMPDLELEQIDSLICDQLLITSRAGSRALADMRRQFERAREFLRPLRSNSRARATWGLFVAFGTVRNSHLMAGLDLSRAGVSLQLKRLRHANLL